MNFIEYKSTLIYYKLNMHLNYANFTQGGSTNKKILELLIPPHPHRSKNIISEINITFPPPQGKSETSLMLYTQFFSCNII